MIKVTCDQTDPECYTAIEHRTSCNNIIIVSPLNLQLKHDISSTTAGEVASDDD